MKFSSYNTMLTSATMSRSFLMLLILYIKLCNSILNNICNNILIIT